MAAAENHGEAAAAGEVTRGGQVGLWDAASGRRRATLEGPRGVVLVLAFAPDGKTLVSGGGCWNQFGEVTLWDLASGAERLTLHGNAEWVECVAFAPDGRTLVTGGGTLDSRGEVKLWDLRRPRPGAPRPLSPVSAPARPAARQESNLRNRQTP